MRSDNEPGPRPSPYRRLERPTFVSKVPEHLMVGLTDMEKYIVETMSKTDQKQDWNTDVALETNQILLDVDSRLRGVEDWKMILTSKWALIIGFLIWLTPAGIVVLLQYIIQSHEP